MMSWRGFCRGGIQICPSGAQRSAGTYSRSALRDHYQVLGVGREASKSQIKDAFFALSKKCHPDSDPSNPLLHAQFVRINDAYKVLSKPSSRKEYDQLLEALRRNGPVYRAQSPYKSSSRADSTTYTYRKEEPYNGSTTNSDSWYWSQFTPQSDFDETANQRQERNKTIVWGCIMMVFSSIYLHFFVFRTLRDVRNKEMEEQQKKILDFYNKTKDAAQTNGISKQQELLIQRHEERLRKLYGFDVEAKK
ncbi:dnaJ homolog subfamily C member 4 isoform X2 [Rana temporaria]|nr:dnaJ homolog subfamily C member 4 isoform X2 [Rana temporaria]